MAQLAAGARLVQSFVCEKSLELEPESATLEMVSVAWPELVEKRHVARHEVYRGLRRNALAVERDALRTSRSIVADREGCGARARCGRSEVHAYGAVLIGNESRAACVRRLEVTAVCSRDGNGGAGKIQSLIARVDDINDQRGGRASDGHVAEINRSWAQGCNGARRGQHWRAGNGDGHGSRGQNLSDLCQCAGQRIHLKPNNALATQGVKKGPLRVGHDGEPQQDSRKWGIRKFGQNACSLVNGISSHRALRRNDVEKLTAGINGHRIGENIFVGKSYCPNRLQRAIYWRYRARIDLPLLITAPREKEAELWVNGECEPEPPAGT